MNFYSSNFVGWDILNGSPCILHLWYLSILKIFTFLPYVRKEKFITHQFSLKMYVFILKNTLRKSFCFCAWIFKRRCYCCYRCNYFISTGFYIPGFPKLLRYQEHHDKILNKFLPKLKKHLDRNGVDTGIYTLKWFFQCFLDRVSLKKKIVSKMNTCIYSPGWITKLQKP